MIVRPCHVHATSIPRPCHVHATSMPLTRGKEEGEDDDDEEREGFHLHREFESGHGQRRRVSRGRLSRVDNGGAQYVHAYNGTSLSALVVSLNTEQRTEGLPPRFIRADSCRRAPAMPLRFQRDKKRKKKDRTDESGTKCGSTGPTFPNVGPPEDTREERTRMKKQ